MCLAIPGQIVDLLPNTDLATVDVSGVRRSVNIALLQGEGISAGDWVLIHVGFAMSRIDEVEAKNSLEFLEALGDAYEDEVAALRSSTDPESPPGGRQR